MIAITRYCYSAWSRDLSDDVLAWLDRAGSGFTVQVDQFRVYVWCDPHTRSLLLIRWPQFSRFSREDLV
jgi:hypothetical protein